MNVAKYSESTLTKILNIIDDYSHNKDEELASLLCIGIKEVGYFVIQFNIFDSMGSCCDNKYVNYFYKINIITCELVELEHEKDTFIKAIVLFIRGRMQEKYCDILEHLTNEIEDLEIIFDLDTNHMITQYYK